MTVADKRSTARTRSGSEGTSDRALEAVRVRLLGGFKVSVGSRTIGQAEWPLRKAANLLKLLALAPGHRLHRERVMDDCGPIPGEGPPPTACGGPSTRPAGFLIQTQAPATWLQRTNSLCCVRRDFSWVESRPSRKPPLPPVAPGFRSVQGSARSLRGGSVAE